MRVTKNKVFSGIIAAMVIMVVAVWYFATSADNASMTERVSKVEPKKTTATDSRNNKTVGSEFAMLKGDAFDEAYIAGMIAHHEGAINMSEQAMSATAREEIRMLASDITQTQSVEMIKMRDWQKAWGFEITSSGGHLSHGGSGAEMAGDMVEMMDKLKGLSGDAHDREFLKQMILHHEQAIEMSVDAETNAKRQEVKDLAQGVITAQTAEIKQMKQWQKEWGYES